LARRPKPARSAHPDPATASSAPAPPLRRGAHPTEVSLRLRQHDPAQGTGNPLSGWMGEAAVDRQVQVIWHALVQRHLLSCINPLPSDGNSTQHVHTPSQVMGERRGTCIHLALLLASCLESVDIDPVLFLLTGHAAVSVSSATMPRPPP